MRQSDVFVLPSIEEGSALVTYEAQASGCVLVVSTATGARCRDGIEGLVHEPRDTSTLTAQLRSVRANRDLLRQLRAASLRQAASLSWADAADELVSIYTAAAQHRP